MMWDALANFHFIRPWWLGLAPIVAGAWWLRQRRSDPLRAWRAQMDPDLLQALTVRDGTRNGQFASAWMFGSLLTLVSLAGPTWRLEPSPFAEDTSPLMILLQAGNSMDRGDVPTSPMERARLKIKDLAKVRQGQPLGLIAYAGSAHLVLPPTRDTDVVAEMAAEINPDVMPVPGDRLDLALQAAGRLLTAQQEGGTLLIIAESVQVQIPVMATVQREMDPYFIQFLALSDRDSESFNSISDAASTLHATVQHLTADEEDVAALAHAAARRSLTGIAGTSNRWQEAGYWIIPVIALLVGLSFRQEAPALMEGIA